MHQKGVWRIVRRYIRSDADAADVTQLVFVRAFKGLASFRGAASVRSWLFRIAINCALSWIRDHRREVTGELADDALVDINHAPGRIAGEQEQARLRGAIEQLPPKQKLVLELRVFDDLSFKEVAELADCSENTAKVNFHYAAASPELPPRVRGGDGGGVIVYTSGTTGKPKGASRAWNRTGFESVADMVYQCGMRADDRHLVVCPLYHSAAPAFVAIMQSLGATIVLMNHFDPEGALDIIQKERITCSLMVPTMLVRITNLPKETLRRYKTSSLRWVMSVAAPLSTEAARRFMDRFGPVLWNFYGSTETGLVTIAGPGDHVTRPGTIGKRMRGNDIRLLDDTGHDVPVGQVGELYARNSTMITGYHANDEATKQSQRDGFFSVGDMGRVDAAGYYFLESRKHDMVISGGVNIYPREIEDCLHTHPAVLEAAVIGVPDPEWGETLRAFVVLRTGQQASESELIDYCRRDLADFKRPRKVTFLHELPRNPTGKVLKRELRDFA